VDHLVQEEMFQLRTNAQYKVDIVSLKSYCSNFSIVESFNAHSLTLYFEDVLIDPNLLTLHILCLNETRIRNVHLNSKIYNVLSQKFHILSCYDEHGIMVLYDDDESLIESATITNYGKIFTILLNDNTREALYIIAIYKPPTMQVSHFNSILESIVPKMPSHFPTIIIGNFNIEFFTKTNQSSKLQAFMNKYN
jgi:hypothetical protein